MDESGAVVEATDYYPFGLRMPGRSYLNGVPHAKEGLTGKETDSESGFIYFGARYYDPAIGRFLSFDPLTQQFPEWSPYVYSFNNPVNYFDPDGLAGLTAKKRQFYKSVGKNIITAASEKGISETKSYFIIAQRIQENGWGTTAPGNNLFNIKGEYKGASITITTHEEDSKGNRTKIVDKFRKYDSQSESIKDYLKVLENNFPDAYKALTDDNKTVDDFVKGLENGTKGKYATDADYGDQIKKLYKQIKKEYEQYKKEQEEKNKKKNKEKKSQKSSGD
jgi:RHS repeat-associated protein